MIDRALANEDFCYVTTTGRVTGNPHTIEIWFALREATIYLLSGGRARSDWVKNVTADPHVTVRVGTQSFGGTARRVADTEEGAWARRALLEKYRPGYSGDLTNWSQRSLLIAINLDEGSA